MKKAMKELAFFKNYSLFYLKHLYYLQIVIRSHLDYSDVIYDEPSNDSFSNKLETVQYKTVLAISGAKKRYISRKTVSRIRVKSIVNKEDGGGAFAYFTKLLQLNFQLTSMILFLS